MNLKISDPALIGSLVDTLMMNLVPSSIDDLYTGSVTHNTESVTANVTGGVGPHTYSWALISGDGALVLQGGTTSATVYWQVHTDGSTTYSAYWKCTVTDSRGFSVSKNIVVTVEPSI